MTRTAIAIGNQKPSLMQCLKQKLQTVTINCYKWLQVGLHNQPVAERTSGSTEYLWDSFLEVKNSHTMSRDPSLKNIRFHKFIIQFVKYCTTQ